VLAGSASGAPLFMHDEPTRAGKDIMKNAVAA